MCAVVREYDYKPRWSLILLCGGFFALCLAVLGTKATTNDRGLVINGIVELGTDSASVFYWALTAVSAAFVLLSLLLVYHRIALRQRLVLGEFALLVPRTRFSRDPVEIAYRDIKGMARMSMNGQQFLYVTHSGGRYTINATMLPSRVVFEEVCDLLEKKVRTIATA
jgi:hypothetical protein